MKWAFLASTLMTVGLPAAGQSVDAGIAAPEVGSPGFDLPRPDVSSEVLQEANLGWALVRTFVVLCLVLAIIYFTLSVGMRRLMGIVPARGGGLIRVLQRVSLDQKRVLYVVRAGQEVLLLGGSDASLNLISKLDPAEVEKATAAVEPSPFLAKLLGSTKKT
jgi:flagellar protein FliO/FliZ